MNKTLALIIVSLASLTVCLGRGSGAGVASALSPVTLNIDAQSPGHAIPADFVGLSFETAALQYDSVGVNGYLFDSSNKQLLMLFKNLGIRNLRIGGTSVDTNKFAYIPSHNDIDALFRFVKAADVQTIYSLRLLNGDTAQDASAAKYVWNKFRPYLACLAIGNEPNLYRGRAPEITNGDSFIDAWEKFATAITNSVPDVKLAGPDTGTGGTSWAADFAKREAGSGMVTCIFSHYYVGGFPKGDAQKLIDGMLSPVWDAVKYPAYYNKIGATSLSNGFPYRLTELNSYVAGYPGVWGGNNSFATALFALDCMHWWAEHDCRGVNFHTVVGKYNGTIYRDENGSYQVYPIGYGIKAFDIGGHGKTAPVAITNPNNLNLTAYAVTDTDKVFVTIINKEHEDGARGATVQIKLDNFPSGNMAAMYLANVSGNVAATGNITLGGASINNNAPWPGKWTALSSTTNGQRVVTVPASSAAIIKISAR